MTVIVESVRERHTAGGIRYQVEAQPTTSRVLFEGYTFDTDLGDGLKQAAETGRVVTLVIRETKYGYQIVGAS